MSSGSTPQLSAEMVGDILLQEGGGDTKTTTTTTTTIGGKGRPFGSINMGSNNKLIGKFRADLVSLQVPDEKI